MLMAILYCEPDRVAAAALACDQMALGDAYWRDVFSRSDRSWIGFRNRLPYRDQSGALFQIADPWN